MRAIAKCHPTENSCEKQLPAIQEVQCRQDGTGRQAGLFHRQPANAETRARMQIAAQDALISHLQQRLLALEHESLPLRLRTQVEDYAAKLVVERARAERAEASAAQWKRSAMKNGERYLRLREQLAQARCACAASGATPGRAVSPSAGAIREHDTVAAPAAGTATGSGS